MDDIRKCDCMTESCTEEVTILPKDLRSFGQLWHSIIIISTKCQSFKTAKSGMFAIVKREDYWLLVPHRSYIGDFVLMGVLTDEAYSIGREPTVHSCDCGCGLSFVLHPHDYRSVHTTGDRFAFAEGCPNLATKLREMSPGAEVRDGYILADPLPPKPSTP